MAADPSVPSPGTGRHRWTFFRAGGFDQVRLATGADLMALEQLDQKLWVALSCPTRGLELDGRTLEMIDTDGDGRIRVPEVIGAVRWAGALLKNPDDLTQSSAVLPLNAISDQSEEGRQLLASARHILNNLGRADATAISADDTSNAVAAMAEDRFKGDGIIPADAADDPAVGQAIADIIDCLGADEDRSGKPGISQDRADRFFADAEAYAAWWREAETQADIMLPLGEATASAADRWTAVRAKVDDYFTRCRLAAFDIRALGAVNRQEEEYRAFADRNLSPSLEQVSDFPLAIVDVGKALPLKQGINPAWSEAMASFCAEVVTPLTGDRDALTEEDWARIGTAFAPYTDWLARKAGATVEKLGIGRVRDILGGPAREAIAALITRDRALAAAFDSIVSVDRLVRYRRDLFTVLNNFVSFGDFYTGRGKAAFQAGTLYLDGRACDLCVRVDDMGRHAALATLSRICLAYCQCTRSSGTDSMTIAAAFTGGDSDFLMAGRNGVFYDRQGNDWDATIVKVIDHPISVRQAFWSPYKKFARMIESQIEKLASARDKAVTDKAATGIADAGQKVDAGKAAAPAAPFDVAKFAGIFAAIGLAVGAIGTALAAAFTGFLKLAWWQMPLVLAGVMLLISTPSMIMAWLKLRQRNLAPILDANGWAVNARVRINIPFGGSLTAVATLPEGAVRRQDDPFAEKKSRWPEWILLGVLALIVLYLFARLGFLGQWPCRLFG